MHLRWPDSRYLGWFGPVGVSAVTLEAEELGLPETVMAAGIMAVVVSTVAPGVTSSAWQAALPTPQAETTTRQPTPGG